MVQQEYVQCRLKRGKTQQVAWIPREFAKVGKTIRIKDEDGWRVVGCGAVKSEEYVLDHRNDYRKQREASDI